MARAGAAMFFLPHVRRQMLAEVRAQFEAFRATGLTLDHVTAHKHFQLHPSILSAILELAKEFGVPAVRAPARASGDPGADRRRPPRRRRPRWPPWRASSARV